LTTPAASATKTYDITDVKFLVTASAPGSQLGAEMNYTFGGCTAHYHVDAVWPATLCNAVVDRPNATSDQIPFILQDAPNQAECTTTTGPLVTNQLTAAANTTNFALTCQKVAGATRFDGADAAVPFYRCLPTNPFPSTK